MAAQNYDACLKRVLRYEGGYSNHPSDPGGPTKFGITIHDYRRYISPSGTADDVRNMKVDEAKTIYRARYWGAERCDQLEPGVDHAIFDYGVNSGIGRSGKVLRRLVGLPSNTSVVTPEVVRAANARDQADLVNAICNERLRFLKNLRTWPVFGKGWNSRVSDVRDFAGALAKNQPPIVGVPPETPGKGEHPKPPGGGTVGPAGGGIGAALAGISAWMDAHPALTVAIIVGAIVISAALVVYLRGRWETRQEEPMPGTPVLPAVRAMAA